MNKDKYATNMTIQNSSEKKHEKKSPKGKGKKKEKQN